MTPDQAIGLILFAPAVFFLIIGSVAIWTINKIKSERRAKAKAQATKAYNDSLFFMDINGECKFYKTN